MRWKWLQYYVEQDLNQSVEIDRVEWAEHALGVELDPWQKNVLENPHKRRLLLTPRQAGKTTVTAAIAGSDLVATPNIEIVVISPTQRQSGIMFGRVSNALESSGAHIVRQTATRVELGNGSILYSLPGDRPSTVRGHTADLLLIDEAAQVKPELLAACLPMVGATDGSILMLSTPAGARGVFYDTWSSNDSEWDRVKVDVNEIPRLAPVLETMKKRLGRMYDQEYGLEWLGDETALFSAEMLDQIFSDSVPWEPITEPEENVTPFERRY